MKWSATLKLNKPSPEDIISGAQAQPEAPTPKVGRPKKGETWADVIGDELDKESIQGVSRRRKIVKKIADLAEAGVLPAADFLSNREDGKPRQQVDLTGKDGGPLTVTVVSYKDEPPKEDA